MQDGERGRDSVPLGFRIFVLSAIIFLLGEGLGQAPLLGFVCGRGSPTNKTEFLLFLLQ